MNIALPSDKRTASVPVLVGLLGALAIAIVAGLTDGLWRHDTGLDKPVFVSAPETLSEAPRFLTIVLVASQAEADQLRNLSAEAESLLPSNTVREDVVVLVAGTPEEESLAVSSIYELTGILAGEPAVPFKLVDTRVQDTTSR